MFNFKSTRIFFFSMAMLCSGALAQGRPDPAKLIPAQQAALAKLASMDGLWRGTASTLLPSGEKHTLTQTERIGPFLDGAVKVIEGRGYDAQGKVVFNSFGTLSFNPDKGTYTLHSYAMGSVGDFSFTPTETGFIWEIPAGPMVLRYTATIKDGVWNQVGDRMMPGKDPVRFFEMNLKRIGDTTWPAAGWIADK